MSEVRIKVRESGPYLVTGPITITDCDGMQYTLSGDLVALCQFLPGPASSQTGFSIGLLRAGYPGALAAWCGFTLPSAIASPRKNSW